MTATPNLDILDIGCIGLMPLQFWEPLLGQFPFHLTGVNSHGIEAAEALVATKGIQDQVTLLKGSGYTLSSLFKPETFDVVVATQMLEHVPQLQRFMRQVSRVMRPGAEGWFTLDSAHWRSRYDRREPIRLVKNVVKKGLSLVGKELHYDLPWFDYEVEAACNRAGLKVEKFGYYNLEALKPVHNHLIPTDQKNPFMKE